MKVFSLLIFATLMINISALEAEVRHKVMVKDTTYTCLFKMHYEENTCLDTSQAFCSPKIKGKKRKTATDVRFVLNDGITIHVEKLRLLKSKRTKIIGCKAISPITTNTTGIKPEFIFETIQDKDQSTKQSSGSRFEAAKWRPQADTNKQYTLCHQIRDGGDTCLFPEIRYGTTERGIPVENPVNDYNAWCKQLFGREETGSITTGRRECITNYGANYGALFWCSGGDDKGPHWCDWKDVYWRDGTLDLPNCGSDGIITSANAITSLTCKKKGTKKCVTSPGFPKYPNGLSEKINLDISPGHAMKITFEAFELEDYGCRFDYVQFFDNNGAPVANKLCGKTLPSPFIIQSSTASFLFVTDVVIQKKGFRFCYEPHGGACQHKDKFQAWRCSHWAANGDCTNNWAQWMAKYCAKTCKC